MARIGGGINWIFAGAEIGIPPIKNFANNFLKDQYLIDLYTGKISACLAISEPQAASDIANLHTKGEDKGDY